jgi:hypothetical protein
VWWGEPVGQDSSIVGIITCQHEAPSALICGLPERLLKAVREPRELVRRSDGQRPELLDQLMHEVPLLAS